MPPGGPQPATIEDLQAIIETIEQYWGERDVIALHQALYVHEFGDTAHVLRATDGTVLAYLLGFLSPAGAGYIHAVAVRQDHRRAGLARILYDHFESLARARGAVALKAITNPRNSASRRFHRALGFQATDVAGYSVSGESRTVFWRKLD